jgi:diguanylate cyclase (GGDEF)-like protein/PAS domain S-box-containing protein
VDDKRNILKNGRKTIGLVLGTLDSNYHEEIMRGACDVAKEKGFNVLSFIGGPIGSPNPLVQLREKVFELVDIDLLDGIIITVGSQTRYLTKEKTKEFISRFSTIPFVNIGGYIEGHTNIITNNATGLEQLLDHLIQEHGYKRMALFRGPKNHLASEERMVSYKQILTKHNIPIDENLIVYGEIQKTQVADTVDDFWKREGKNCDAIIAVNDNQALGIIERLKQKGVRVPEDIAVSGMMGISEGVFSDPPLTTIMEPLYDLGKNAVLALADKIEGKRVPSKILLPTELVIRQSCGCKLKIKKPFSDSEFNQSVAYVERNALDRYVFTSIKEQCTEICEKYRCQKAAEFIPHLLVDFHNALGGKEYKTFIDTLRKFLEDVLKTEYVLAGMSIISVFQNSILYLINEGNQSQQLVNLLESLLALKDDIEGKAIIFQKTETAFYIKFFRDVVSDLNSFFDFNAIKNYAIKILDSSECYISVFENKNKLTKAINMMAVRNNEVVNLDESQKRFIATDILPSGVATYTERYSLLVFGLSFRNEVLGFMVLNLSERKGPAYENMQAIISTALKNELQIHDLEQAEQRFSDIAYNTSDWLWETDTDNCFTYCSRSVINVLGYYSEEMIGKKIFESSFLSNVSYEKMMKSRRNLVNIECRKRHKNGSMVYLLISAKPVIIDNIFVGYRGVFKDITEQKIQEEKIKNLAYYDTLTGLPNRTLFQSQLKHTMEIAKYKKEKFALMFLDVDRFKYINDSMGHTAGDLLLKKIAGRLGNCIGKEDILARLGGDEFTIILPRFKEENQVIEIANNILKELGQHPIIIDGKKLFTTASIGIAFYPADGENTLSIVKNADTAMYKAKDLGRNQFALYNRQINKLNESRIKHEEILYSSFTNNDFYVEYQPQVDCITGALTGLEALVRIENQEFGKIPPNDFIPLAEELGLIGRIDEWVLNEVCRQHNVWKLKGYGNIKIAVNLSAFQLRDKEVIEKYIGIIHQYNVEPSDINLEITENSLIENEDIALEIIEEFKKHGLSISLDDFGTGYSSLQCIQMYPIDVVKIDRSFVKDSIANKKNIAIIKAIRHMADSLNLKIVAEGVENNEQFKMISSLGCNEIQGYYFCKPTSGEAIEAMLAQDFRYKMD